MNKHFASAFALLMILIVSVMPVIGQDNNENPIDQSGDTIVIDTEQAADTIIAVTESAATSISGLVTEFLNRLFNVSRNQYVQVLMVVAGVILLLAGWRIYNWIIVLAGAITGGTIALATVGNAGVVIEVAAFLVGALIGGAVGYFLYWLAVFFVGAYIGIVFTTLVAQSLNLLPLSPYVILVMAIIGGLIMLGLSFELLVVLASLLGAQLIVLALGLTPTLVWLVLLTLLGIVVQIGLTRRSGFNVRRRPSRRMLI